MGKISGTGKTAAAEPSSSPHGHRRLENPIHVSRAVVALAILVTFILCPITLRAAPAIESCPIFPADNIWNVPVDTLPVHDNSAAFITTIGADSHVHADYVVSPYYDSMIGKLIVHQNDREEAIACMKRALAELRIEGVETTVPRLLEILNHPAFTEARVDTTFIERTWPG